MITIRKRSRRRRTLFYLGIAAELVVVAAGRSTARASDYYWDSNGTTSGAGAVPAGTWGSSAFWSTSAAGTIATGVWSAGNAAIFSAGSDATGSYSVTVTGTQ